MKKISKYIICLLCATAVACILYFYSTPIVTQLGRWQVARVCKRTFGAPMSHAGVDIKDGAITIYNPCFTHTVDENQGWNLSAEALLIQGRFLPWQKDRFVDVTLIKPKVNVYTEADGKPVFDWFHFANDKTDGRWHLDEGELNVYSATSNEVISLQLHGEGELGSASQAMLRLSMSGLPDSQITLSYQAHEDASVMGFEVCGIDSAPLVELVKRLDPRVARGWQVDGGTLNGHGALHLTHEGLPYATGEIELRDLVFCHLSSQAKGWIPLTTIQLEKEPQQEPELTGGGFLTRLAQGTRGQLEFLEPGRIIAQPPHTSAWALRNITGSVTLDSADITLDLQSTLGYANRSCFFHAAGCLVVSEPLWADLGLSWIPASADSPVSTSRLLLRETVAGDQLVTLDLVNIGTEQAVMLHAIASDLFPEAAGAHLSSGKLSGLIELVVHEGNIQQVALEDLAADNLAFSIPHWHLDGKLAQATGSFFAEASQNGRIHNVSSNLTLKGGQLQFQGVDGVQQLLNEVRVDLQMIRGRLKGVNVAAKLDGLEGTLTSGQLEADEGVQIRLQGPVADLSNKLPVGVRQALLRSFAHDTFDAAATVRVEDPFFTIEGLCQVTDSNGELDCLPFGLRMRHEEADAATTPSGLGTWLELAMALAEAHLSDPVGQVVIEDGWVSGRGLQAAKYALPLIRKPVPTSLIGTLDFNVYFEDDLLTVQYEGHDIILACNAFTITVPKLGDLSLNTAESERAFHYFNLETGDEKGIIPVHAGHFIEHRTGLEFQDCSGYVSVQSDRVEITEVTTLCERLAAHGTVTVEDIDANATDVTIVATTMEGPVSGAQRLLAHVTSSPLFDLPIAGHAAIEEEGFRLVLHMGQDDPHEAQVTARLQGGAWEAQSKECALSDLTAQINYDHRQGLLCVRDAGGVYEANDASFVLAIDAIAITDFPHGAASFDLALHQEKIEAVRLKGSLGDADTTGLRTVQLDTDRSHLGNLRANSLECSIRDWTKPTSVQLTTHIDLANTQETIAVLKSLGLTWSPDAMLSNLLGSDPSGHILATVNYEASGGLWSIEAHGKQLMLQGRHFEQLKTTCKASAGSWTINELVLDDLTAQLALQQTTAGWELPFFYANYADMGAIELTGSIDKNSRAFGGELRSLTLALDQVQRIPWLGSLCQKLDASGHLTAHGALQLRPDVNAPSGWAIGLDAQASLEQVRIAGVFVHPKGVLHVSLSPQNELMLDGVQAALLPASASLADHRAVSASLDHAVCQLDSGNWSIDALRFAAPHDQLAWLADAISTTYPNAGGELSAASLQALERLKPDGEIAGHVFVAKEEGEIQFMLRLDDGEYQLGNLPLELKNAELVSQGGITRMSAQTIYNGKDFWVTTSHDPLSPDLKEVVISDCPLANRPVNAPPPLFVTLRRGPDGCFGIDRIKGALKGAAVDLTCQQGAPESNATSFLGSIHVSSNEALELLPGGVGAMARSAGLGGGYHLNGRFVLPQNQASRLSFFGTLTGERFVAKGYELQSLKANVHFTPESFLLRSVSIHDPAGHIYIDRIAGHKQPNGQWAFEAPSVKMTNLQPGLLHAPGNKPRMKRPLVITYAELTGLQGMPGTSGSWRGKGALHFSRTLPASAQLQIPEELRHRRNLSSSRLTPAQGTVQFSIHDRGFYIDRMQHTYSEGKSTQFYLAKGQGPSYIDFNGQLHLKMRVKQRNLILKLTEPFTVHVKGPLDKPRWSLRATKKSS